MHPAQMKKQTPGMQASRRFISYQRSSRKTTLKLPLKTWIEIKIARKDIEEAFGLIKVRGKNKGIADAEEN